METDERRAKLRERLQNIVDSAQEVGEIMGELPHRNGKAHKSLKPKSGEYIVHSENGFSSHYRGEDGKFYEINVHIRD